MKQKSNNNVSLIEVSITGLNNKRSQEYSTCEINIMGLGGTITKELTTVKDDNYNAIVSFNRDDVSTAIRLLESVGFTCKYYIN